MMTVEILHRMLTDVIAAGGESSVIVFREKNTPLVRLDGRAIVQGLIPAVVDGEATCLIVDNSELIGGLGIPVCLVACDVVNKPIRYRPKPCVMSPDVPQGHQSDPER